MELLDKLNIKLLGKPNRIAVAELVRTLELSARDKKFLESRISSIYLVSILNDEILKIRAYEDENFSFQSIYVCEIELKTDKDLKILLKFIHSAFVEPSLILIKYNNTSYISCAEKRLNKLNNDKCVIEDVYFEKVTGDHNFNLKDISEKNLKLYYEKIIQKIFVLKVFNNIGIKIDNINYDYKKIKELIKQYEELVINKNNLEIEYKNEKMFRDKIKIDKEICKINQKISKIVSDIKGDNC
ncbi:MAG: DUF4391 domain-containing protein [Bdellovibrionota bacterium]|nr:DUF4391 domain-containing protein [Pseudomonadota bacterium]MDY6091463.1 DUF4391 domain-containing protein [Bdellovibrionota bacterium]